MLYLSIYVTDKKQRTVANHSQTFPQQLNTVMDPDSQTSSYSEEFYNLPNAQDVDRILEAQGAARKAVARARSIAPGFPINKDEQEIMASWAGHDIPDNLPDTAEKTHHMMKLALPRMRTISTKPNLLL